MTCAFGTRAAVANRVAVLVGDRDAPGGLGVPRGGGGQVARQPRVDRAQAREFPGPVRETGQGGQRDGEGDPSGEAARCRGGCAVLVLAGPGVLAQQQVQVGAGA